MKVKITENRIYYIEDYYPYRYSNTHIYEETNSRKIMDLKDNQDYAIRDFSIDLYEVIKEILLLNSIIGEKVGLAAVPPSKVNKESPIRACIEQLIINYYEAKDYRINTLVECKFLLERYKDVKESHLGDRNLYQDHINSIKCNCSLATGVDKIILIDDVTTEGITMNACTDILINSGISKEKIYRLAIGKTV